MVPTEYRGGNLLIDALPALERARVVAHLSVFEPEVPDLVIGRDDPFEDVLFPIDAVFSITAELRRGDVYEVAAVGREGVIGAELVLDMAASPRAVMSQVGGTSARMSSDVFSQMVAGNRALVRGVYRHIVHRLFIAEQLIACNFAHDVTERCARWMLMFRDQTGRDEFVLRDEFLCMMLGAGSTQVQRATAILQRSGVLRYEDELFSALDPAGLREVACECYEAQRRYAPFAHGGSGKGSTGW